MINVVKIGGSVVDNDTILTDVLRKCAAFGEPFVLVHGGGVMATRMAEQLGLVQTMVDGRRITDPETMKILVMTLAGLANKSIVARLQALGVTALGVCGADADLIRASKRQHPTIDFGMVGDVQRVDADRMRSLLGQGMSLVVAPVTHDGNGTLFNTNADTVAGSIAAALGSDAHLRFVFDYPGLMLDTADATSMVETVDAAGVRDLLNRGVITKGMMPKMEAALHAASHGAAVQVQQAVALGTDYGTKVLHA